MEILERHSIPDGYKKDCKGATKFFAERQPDGHILYHPFNHVSYSPRIVPPDFDGWDSISVLDIGVMHAKEDKFALLRVSRDEYEKEYGKPSVITQNPETLDFFIYIG